MTQSHRRHDISDKVWLLPEEHLPGRKGAWGGVASDNRQFINAVSGLYERVLHGEIYRRTTEAGAIHTVVLFAGVTKVSGRSCWKS